ncbi:YceI family protein [Candidatus Halobeggiatoa sp. HSG11]|nr:YceI family protein [Candidatus Halobeggiatoa sp. HSG11]
MKIIRYLILSLSIVATNTMAADYIIDKEGMHATIQFKILHLGYSWLLGRFNDFEGTFSYDPTNPKASKVAVTINTTSIDSNHAERDKHLRGEGFLEVKQHPQAKFISTAFEPTANGNGVLKGDFTLHGVTRNIAIDVKFIGEGADPWGGYRIGFEGTTRLALADYDIKRNLGPKSKEVELFLAVEGIRK